MPIAADESRLEHLPWTAVLHEWVIAVDHKKIGVMYIVLAFVMLVDRGSTDANAAGGGHPVFRLPVA